MDNIVTSTAKSVNSFIEAHRGNFTIQTLFDRAETEVVDRNIMFGQSVEQDAGVGMGRSLRRRRMSDAMIDGGYSDPKDRETYLVYPIEHEATVSVWDTLFFLCVCLCTVCM
ncbi:hypothetical protein EON65_31195 [archaeon]|nr:MAG: hypothetical protein EON65_31195 [archaeon]